jgi:hypothetical protein
LTEEFEPSFDEEKGLGGEELPFGKLVGYSVGEHGTVCGLSFFLSFLHVPALLLRSVQYRIIHLLVYLLYKLLIFLDICSIMGPRPGSTLWTLLSIA